MRGWPRTLAITQPPGKKTQQAIGDYAALPRWGQRRATLERSASASKLQIEQAAARSTNRLEIGETIELQPLEQSRAVIAAV